MKVRNRKLLPTNKASYSHTHSTYFLLGKVPIVLFTECTTDKANNKSQSVVRCVWLHAVTWMIKRTRISAQVFYQGSLVSRADRLNFIHYSPLDWISNAQTIISMWNRVSQGNWQKGDRSTALMQLMGDVALWYQRNGYLVASNGELKAYHNDRVYAILCYVITSVW